MTAVSELVWSNYPARKCPTVRSTTRKVLHADIVRYLDAGDRWFWQPMHLSWRKAQWIIVVVLDTLEALARPFLPQHPGSHRRNGSRVPAMVMIFAVQCGVNPRPLITEPNGYVARSRVGAQPV